MSETVFLLWHSHDVEGCDEAKLLGVYSSEESAQIRLERSRDLPGFKDFPEGFVVDRSEVDRDWWVDGFVTV